MATGRKCEVPTYDQKIAQLLFHSLSTTGKTLYRFNYEPLKRAFIFEKFKLSSLLNDIS